MKTTGLESTMGLLTGDAADDDEIKFRFQRRSLLMLNNYRRAARIKH